MVRFELTDGQGRNAHMFHNFLTETWIWMILHKFMGFEICCHFTLSYLNWSCNTCTLLKIRMPTHSVDLSKSSAKRYLSGAYNWPTLSYLQLKRFVQRETAAIFFSIEPWSKTGYWLGVCHGWFHFHGLARVARNAKQARITKWKILTNSGIRTNDPLLWKPPPFPPGHEIWY